MGFWRRHWKHLGLNLQLCTLGPEPFWDRNCIIIIDRWRRWQTLRKRLCKLLILSSDSQILLIKRVLTENKNISVKWNQIRVEVTTELYQKMPNWYRSLYELDVWVVKFGLLTKNSKTGNSKIISGISFIHL